MKLFSFSKKTLLCSLLLIVLECAYPIYFLCFQNIDELKIQDSIVPLAIYCSIAFIFLLISMLIFFKIEKAAVFTFFVMLFFMNFGLMQNLIIYVIPGFTFLWFGIVVIILLIAIAILLKKYDLDYLVGINIVNIVLFFLIIVNAITAVTITSDVKKDIKNIEVEQYAKNRSNKENIYFFVFDEYGGEKNLEYYCDYDNSEIKKDMESMGFNWSDNSYNTESISTDSILPNILNLNYVTEIGGVPSYNLKYTENPVMYRFFKELGYDINIINHTGFLDESNGNAILKNQKIGSTADEDVHLLKLVSNQGLLPFVFSQLSKIKDKKGNATTEGSLNVALLDEALTASRDIYKYNTGKPTLNVAYIQSPHEPFLYDDKGDYVLLTDANDYSKTDVYINQLKYINTQMKLITENIIKNDPNSIIVFQADHGLRYAEHCMYLYKKKDFNAEVETDKMQNVLNCVYVGGKKIDIEGKSCINTWRTILNEEYGTSYEMIEPEEKFILNWKYRYSQY